MKTFVVKILTSEGLEHHQLIADEDDVTILMEVMKKIERRANKLKAEVREETENKKQSEVAVCENEKCRQDIYIKGKCDVCGKTEINDFAN